MTKRKTTWLTGAAAGLGLWVLAAPAKAATEAHLMIDVTVNAPVSVQVNSVTDSTMTASVTPGGGPVISGSTASVTNNASGINEFWKLSSAAAYDTTAGGAGWALATSTSGAGAPGTDQFAIQAIFVSSNAAAGDCSATIPASAWNQAYAAPLTTTPTKYTSSSGGGFYADTTSIGNSTGNPDNTTGVNNGRMSPFGGAGGVGKRGFCWRISAPSSVTTTDNETLYVIVTASAS